MSATTDHGPATTAPPAAPAPGGGRRHRWLKPVIAFLLIAIPVGYLYISAMQSRAGSAPKREEAARTGPEEGWPSRVQRRIYEVAPPGRSEDVSHFEVNAWKSSSLYLRFTTDRKGLKTFLKRVGTTAAELRTGEVPIDQEQAAVVGWKIGSGEHWAGETLSHDKPRPTLEIAVNTDNPDYPQVFVVSTATP
ncbi:hypothetical protein ACFP1Z_03330 [Streptomyces gamaensis]|uniref:Sugar kinase n=1 Tax=Streptomyces gamaensis TaxID=1763542 RepID=A0ABW0YUN6_9ACTN